MYTIHGKIKCLSCQMTPTQYIYVFWKPKPVNLLSHLSLHEANKGDVSQATKNKEVQNKHTQDKQCLNHVCLSPREGPFLPKLLGSMVHFDPFHAHFFVTFNLKSVTVT